MTGKSAIYRFDTFVANTNSFVLSRNGEPVPLTPKVFETLLAFLERPGEMITKEELLNTVWKDSFVDESNLIQNIAVLRKALGDNDRTRRFIATVPGRGYLFLPTVQRGDTPDQTGRSAQTAARSAALSYVPKWIAIIISAVVAMILLLVYLVNR